MSKKCIRCDQVLPLGRFYKHPRMGDGHLNKCIECTKMDMKAHRIMNPGQYRQYEAVRSIRPERIKANMKHIQEWRSKNPERYKAQNAVNNALRDGRLKRASACQVCGAIFELHAHHADYSKPLDVLWVCPKCHRDLHHTALNLHV